MAGQDFLTGILVPACVKVVLITPITFCACLISEDVHSSIPVLFTVRAPITVYACLISEMSEDVHSSIPLSEPLLQSMHV